MNLCVFIQNNFSNYRYKEYYKHEEKLLYSGKQLSPRENQMLLKQEMKNRTTGADCCPSVIEMIEPEGGRNQEGEYVVLYRDGEYRQRFYELSCHQDILEKPCRFIDKRLHDNSRCVQKYSYTYALVKDNKNGQRKNFPFPERGDSNWTLDYIRVRSGCSCVVTPNTKKKRNRSKHPKRLQSTETGE